MKYIQIYNFRRCKKQVFFLFPHFSSSRRKSWTHFFTLLQVLSVRQKSSACKTVLKSHVNGLVSPQRMAFLWMVMYKLELSVSRSFLSSFWFSIICHASIGHTSNNPRVFFKRRFLINGSFKANMSRLLLKNFFLINVYLSRGTSIRKIMGENLTWLHGCNADKQDIKAFFLLCEIKSTYIDIL